MRAAYLRAKGVASTPTSQGRYPISTATLWRWVAQGKFPQPERLSTGVTAWRVDLLDQWDATRAKVSA